jgi:hypothetical protein
MRCSNDARATILITGCHLHVPTGLNGTREFVCNTRTLSAEQSLQTQFELKHLYKDVALIQLSHKHARLLTHFAAQQLPQPAVPPSSSSLDVHHWQFAYSLLHHSLVSGLSRLLNRVPSQFHCYDHSSTTSVIMPSVPLQLSTVKRFEPIAQGKSSSYDPTTPSLLTFPAEIRNAIFDILFHVPGGIHISPSWWYATQGMLDNKKLQKILVAGLPLLSTCRQVYQEAASTLFSSNVWVVSRSLHEFEHRRNGIMKQAAGAARLLREFRTGAAMIKKINIELDKTCSQRCLIHDTYSCPENDTHGVYFALQIRNLLAWITPRPDLQVEFVHPKGKTHQDFSSWERSNPVGN